MNRLNMASHSSSDLTNEALLKMDNKNKRSHTFEGNKMRLLEITNDLKKMRKNISDLKDLKSIKKEIQNIKIPKKMKEKIKQKSRSRNIEKVKEDLDEILGFFISKFSNVNTIFRYFKLRSDGVEKIDQTSQSQAPNKHDHGSLKWKTSGADTAKRRKSPRKHDKGPFKRIVSCKSISVEA